MLGLRVGDWGKGVSDVLNSHSTLTMNDWLKLENKSKIDDL